MATRRCVILLTLVCGVTGMAAGLMATGSHRPVALPSIMAPPAENEFSEQALFVGIGARSDVPTHEVVTETRLALLRLNDEGVTLYEIGRFSDALSKFEQAMAADGTDQVSRRNLALTTAQMAWGYLEDGNRAEALKMFAQADQLQPEEGGILQGLGATYYKLGDLTEAAAYLERALGADPHLVPALTLLGEMASRRNHHEDAAGYFARALRLDPSDTVVRDRLERARAERRAQAGLQTLDGPHFTVKFDGPHQKDVAQDVLMRLESAYRDAGRQWGTLPDGRAPVRLYLDGTLGDQTVAPGWAQGLFDGTIRLSVGGVGPQDDRLDAVVRHEYMHAFVHARTGGNVPTWLSEGLALVFENRDPAGACAVIGRAGRLIPLPELHRAFVTFPSTQVPLAYAESEAAARYLLARHGEAAVRVLLIRLGEGRDFASAIEAVTGEDYAAFQSAWVRHLRDTRKTDG